MDVVLVTVDSMRADHCGWINGGGPDLTPTLDALASESLTFGTAVAPGPRTLSSVPVSHTGRHFSRDGFGTDSYDERAARIRSHLDRFETVSERLQREGYATVAFTANPWTSTDTGFDAGFDRFEGVGRTGGEIWSLFRDTPLDKPARLFDRWLNNDTWFCRWRTFYDDLVDEIRDTDRPVFAWAFLLDPHNPYLVPAADRRETSLFEMWAAAVRANRFLGRVDGRTAIDESIDDDTLRTLERAYRDCVRSVDAFVDRLTTDLDNDTIVVFHSDHGEAFGDHGVYGHGPTLYEENVHVPLFVHNADSSETVEAPISTAAIPDIVLSHARGEPADPAEWTSEYAVARTESDSAIALRGERWKYIASERGEELFDLRADPDETDDRSEDRPDVLSTLRTAHDRYLESLPDPPRASAVEGDGAIEGHLRSLGYL